VDGALVDSPNVSWFSPLQVLVGWVPGLAALFAPVDVIDRSTLAKAAVAPWVQLMPGMWHGVSESAWPQVHLLSNALVLWCLPLVSVWYMVRFWRQRQSFLQLLVLTRFEPSRASMFIGPLTFVGGVAVMIAGGILTPGSPSFAEGLTTHSRIGLALMNTAGTLGLGLFAGWSPFIVWANLELTRARIDI